MTLAGNPLFSSTAFLRNLSSTQQQQQQPGRGAASSSLHSNDNSHGSFQVRSTPDGANDASDSPDTELDFRTRSLSAAGAAILSAVIVNPLDVVKTRLQAQAARSTYYSLPYGYIAKPDININAKCPPVCPRGGNAGVLPLCPPSCFHYNGTLDVFYKIIRQEGISRLWRGTNASLALAVPTVGIYLPCYDIFRDSMEKYASDNAPQLVPYVPLFAGSAARSLACIICSPIELARTRMQAQREVRSGVRPPGMWRTLLGVLSSVHHTTKGHVQGVRALWTGVGAQLARDVPFSAICWTTLEPMRRQFINVLCSESNAANILGANFAAGVVAGSIAAAATCPFDVAKTRRQIEKDPTKAIRMTTRQTLMQIWKEGGMEGLFMGVGPRVARAGPSVGIVVSFYEVVKYAIHQTQTKS